MFLLDENACAKNIFNPLIIESHDLIFVDYFTNWDNCLLLTIRIQDWKIQLGGLIKSKLILMCL